MQHRTWAEINLDALAHNYKAIRRRVGKGIGILPAVKADAYGHGASPCARVFESLGADMLGVADFAEAIGLRCAGIRAPILILGCLLPDAVDMVIECRATINISDITVAHAFSAAAVTRGAVIPVHLKVDTGMGRQGVLAGEAVEAALELTRLPGLRLEGIFTHFPSADDDDSFTAKQARDFQDLVNRIASRGINIPLRHTANSAGIMRHPESFFNLVRPGLMLYGGVPAGKDRLDLQPVMALKSRVILLKDFPPGMTLSYGRTYTVKKPMRVAIVPVGYADGLSPRLSNIGHMLVHGRRAPIVGRVCMDQTLLDVSAVPNVALGDEVVVYGPQEDENISMMEVAERIGAVPHEIMCAVGKRVPRIFVTGNRRAKED